MPLIIAGLIRAAIQFAITIGLVEAAKWILNSAIKQTMKWLGATEQQATDIIANSWLQIGEEIVGGAIAIKSKTPTLIAEKLGFTSKGWALRKTIIAGKVAEEIGTTAKVLTSVEKAAVLTEQVASIATKTKTTKEVVMGILNPLMKVYGLGVLSVMALANVIDFGNWNSGAYQKTAQKFLSIFGLQPDKDYRRSEVLSGDMFDKIWTVATGSGIVSLTDPKTGEVLPLTRDNFITVANNVAIPILLENGKVTTAQMLAGLTALATFKSGAAPAGQTYGGGSLAAPAASSGIKVFTGIVSQGTLGSSLSFVARPDDIIESAAELQDAARNNLAAYLATLPGRIIYEVKIVSSVTTKDGFRQVGTRQQVLNGYDSKGNQKYKTLVNKFAILNLYILTDKGTKSKLTSVVLGPTDATRLNPTQQELVGIEQTIQSSVFTSDLNDIRGIETSQPVLVSQPEALTGASIYEVETARVNKLTLPQNMLSGGNAVWGQEAKTLFEFYEANGKPLPPVSERATIYEQYGLGKATLYTGTAEQNVKLLQALKAGSPSSSSPAQLPAQAPAISPVPQQATATYYNNGLNGTEKEVYINEAYHKNRALDKRVAALISNPARRDIPGNLVPDFYNGKISIEQLEYAIQISPTFNTNIGPQINYGNGPVPFVAS